MRTDFARIRPAILVSALAVAAALPPQPCRAKDPNNEPWRLMPVNKIHDDEAVQSSMNFGQLKVGAAVGDLKLRAKFGGKGVELREVLGGKRALVLFYKYSTGGVG